MLALVTGGTGFIGGAVVNSLLEEGHEVRIFSRSGSPRGAAAHERLTVATGDLEEPASLLKALEGVDVFYHVGEIKNITRSASDRNVRLLEEIVPHLAGLGIGRTVFISSITVSGIPASFPADEETPARVLLKDHYTAYKRRCEEILAASVPGRYAVIRPAPVYGPGSRYLGRLVSAVEKLGPVGMPFIGGARNCAPLIFIKDLSSAICRAGTVPQAAGRTFIITDGVRHSWHDFFSAVASRMDKRLRIVPVPPALLKISALPFEFLSGFFGIQMDAVNYLDYFSRDLFFDNARARETLGWQPGYSMERGVAEMVDYFRPGASRP